MVVRSAEPRYRPARRGDETGTLGLAAVSAGALAIAAVADPSTIEDGPVLCPFRLLTGLPCPGCGLTRSWVYAVHGQWADAMEANPFGFVSLGAAVALVIWVVVAALRRRPWPSLTPVFRSRAFKVVVVAWIGFAVARLVVVAAGA